MTKNMLYLIVFLDFTKHDNTSTLLFPDHLPEIIDSMGEWSLSSNVCSFMTITLIQFICITMSYSV